MSDIDGSKLKDRQIIIDPNKGDLETSHKKQSLKKKFLTSFPVRICAIQYMMNEISSFDDFAKQCEYYVEVSSEYNSDFAVFPETFTSQLLTFTDEREPKKAMNKLAEFTDEYINLFKKLAVKYSVNIIGGSHYIKENNNYYNAAYLFRRDGSFEKQYKIHVTPNETKWWGVKPGREINVFNTDCGKIAILICYDIEFPELSRIVTDKGANIIFTPFCTDDRQGYLRVRYCSQARAIENQVYTVIAGNVGNLPNVKRMDIQYAQSGIFTPSDFSFPRDGIVGECSPNIETVIIGDVDLDILKRSRKNGKVRHLENRRHDLYEIIVKTDETEHKKMI